MHLFFNELNLNAYIFLKYEFQRKIKFILYSSASVTLSAQPGSLCVRLLMFAHIMKPWVGTRGQELAKQSNKSITLSQT